MKGKMINVPRVRRYVEKAEKVVLLPGDIIFTLDYVLPQGFQPDDDQLSGPSDMRRHTMIVRTGVPSGETVTEEHLSSRLHNAVSEMVRWFKEQKWVA